MDSAFAVQQVTQQQKSHSSPDATKLMAAASSTPNRGATSNGHSHSHAHGHGTEDSGTFSEIASDLGDHPQTPSSAAAATLEKPNFAIGLELSRNTTSSFTTCPNSPLDQQNQNGASPSTSQEELHLSSVKFNEKYLKTSNGGIGSSVANTSGSYLGLLAENFHAFYQQKLLDIEKEEANNGDHRFCEKKRSSVLKSWINDLMEQNKVLIETVDEMEREAAGKIIHLDSKVFQSSQMAMKHMAIIQEYEQQVQHLLAQKSSLEDEVAELRSEVAKLKRKDASLEQSLNALETDNENLITLITRIRDWGVWDISDMALNEKTFYRLFELYPNLAGSEVQTVFTRERAKEVQETEKQLEDLKVTLENLQKFKISAEQELNQKDNLISNFQAERDELQEKLRMSANENAEYKKSLTEAQNHISAAKLQSAKALSDSGRERDMTEMLGELRDLRNQLRVACTERQNAVAEANSLKEQVNEHVAEVQYMKQQLVNIQNDAQYTRSQVQDVQNQQDKLSSLKDQVQSYQKKYDEAKNMLEMKSDTILNLQRQMDILHSKMVKIERGSRSKSPRPRPRPRPTTGKSSEVDLRHASRSRELKSRRVIDKPPWNEFFVKGKWHDDVKDSTPNATTATTATSTAKSKTPNSVSQSQTRRLPSVSKSAGAIHKERERQKQEPHKLLNSRMLRQPKDEQQECVRDVNSNMTGYVSSRPASANSAQCSGNTFYTLGDTQTGMRYFFANENELSVEELSDNTPTDNVLTEFETFKLPSLAERPKTTAADSCTKSGRSHSQEYEQPPSLPRLVVGKPRSKTPRGNSSTNFHTLDFDSHITPPGNCQTLDALVTEAVKASKQILDTHDPSQGHLSVRVRASHRHHSTRAPGSDGDGARRQISQDYPLETIFKNKHKIPAQESNSLSMLTNQSESEDQTLTSGTESAVSEFLCALPSASQKELVQNWISKNASSSEMLKMEAERAAEANAKKKRAVINVNNVDFTVRRGQSTSKVYEHKEIKNKTSKTRGKLTQTHEQKINIPERERNGHLPNRDQTPASFKGKQEEYVNYSGCNGIAHNNNTEPPPGRNYHVPSPRDEDMHFTALQERISVLESQCATKDTLLSSLECELQVEKLAKENTARAMESKDAEITMQKVKEFLSAGTPTLPIVPSLQEKLLSSYKEILKQEESLSSLKSESESLSMRAELLEKNVLLYKSYVVLGAVEPDYCRGYDFSCRNGNGDGDGQTLMTGNHLPEEILELKKSQEKNRELKRGLDLELAKIRKLQKELEETVAHKFAELTLTATELEVFIGQLKTENVELNSELNELTQNVEVAKAKERAASQENEERKNLINQIQQCVLDLENKDEQIRVRNEQLARYDEYVTRLHAELKNWAKNPVNFIPSGKAQSDSRFLENSTQNELQVQAQSNSSALVAQSQMEKLKECLQKSERRETELRCDNQMLKRTVSSLSVKIEDLVKSMEYAHLENGGQNRPTTIKPAAVPTNYELPLIMTSPQMKQEYYENRQNQFIEESGRHNRLMGQSDCETSVAFQDQNRMPTRNNNAEQENRLQKIESLIEQINGFVSGN